ncbi:MAG: peptidoglycan DD-metalloendopeptidase family protein [Deltaproteobacteria bacterium]|nr:peptidoglycan DD-metalloendopeptidase family protein [Deltaproteobacteria bacterium]
MGKRFTIMVVPDRSSRVRRFRISRASLWSLGLLVFATLAGVTFGAIHYFKAIEKLAENTKLRRQNVELRTELLQVHEKVSSVQSVLDRIQRFDSKLRTITQLHDPKRHLAVGPFDASQPDVERSDAVIDPVVLAIGEQPHLAIGLLGERLEEIITEAERREGSIRQLEVVLRGQKVRLASTPSIWPARGWVTSGFGSRTDPYTGKSTMHRGIDIANQPGIPVVAPARGVVTFAGTSGGFGKVIVIDHGYGLRTRYGHLSEMSIRVGERIDRGDLVGKIGNTGRSTGPHLHYEVEVNGVCENPMNYILED